MHEEQPGIAPSRQFITRWDIDKTYLRSDFERLEQLARSFWERADQKRPIAGADTLLRELSHLASYVHLLSGSPEQLRKKFQTRLDLDGITVDRLTLKPNLQNLLRLRLRALKDQLGYKLYSLLKAKSESEQANQTEILFGDDSEMDALVYSLYADVLNSKISTQQLANLLSLSDTYPDIRKKILDLTRKLDGTLNHSAVIIFIHLDRQTPPSQFKPLGSRVIPIFNYSQAALHLVDENFLPASAYFNIAQELMQAHRFSTHALFRSWRDLEQRGYLSEKLMSTLLGADELQTKEISQLIESMAEQTEPSPLKKEPSGEPVNYESLISSHYARTRNSKKSSRSLF